MTPAVPVRVSCAPFNNVPWKTFFQGKRTENVSVSPLDNKTHLLQLKKTNKKAKVERLIQLKWSLSGTPQYSRVLQVFAKMCKEATSDSYVLKL